VFTIRALRGASGVGVLVGGGTGVAVGGLVGGAGTTAAGSDATDGVTVVIAAALGGLVGGAGVALARTTTAGPGLTIGPVADQTIRPPNTRSAATATDAASTSPCWAGGWSRSRLQSPPSW
jgi:hypothetical protein